MNHREWGLRHFLIPKIIGVIWWVTVFLVVLGGVSNFIIPWYLDRSREGMSVYEILTTIGGLALVLLIIRVFLESLSVIFSIHDRLEEILVELREGKEPSKPGIPPRTNPQLFS